MVLLDGYSRRHVGGESTPAQVGAVERGCSTAARCMRCNGAGRQHAGAGPAPASVGREASISTGCSTCSMQCILCSGAVYSLQWCCTEGDCGVQHWPSHACYEQLIRLTSRVQSSPQVRLIMVAAAKCTCMLTSATSARRPEEAPVLTYGPCSAAAAQDALTRAPSARRHVGGTRGEPVAGAP